MKQIYVIYLTEYLGNKLPRWYIGSTFKENITKKNYHGSPRSKQWMKIFKEEEYNNPHLFKTEIIYECYNREVAIDIERKFQLLANAVERDDYINKAYAGGSFGKCNLTTPASIAKGLETKRKNGTLGCTKETAIKIVEIKRKNGTLNHTEETIEKYKISMTKEDGTWNNNSEKRLKTILFSDENNISTAKQNGLKMRNTRLNKINTDGLNDYEVMSINQREMMNKISETGETEAKRRGKLISTTRKEKGLGIGPLNPRAKRINIYNEKEELMFECHGNFNNICLDNKLPAKSLYNSYKNNSKKLYTTKLPNNKEFIKFTGWFAKEIKEKINV
jgi:hypothetical protein